MLFQVYRLFLFRTAFNTFGNRFFIFHNLLWVPTANNFPPFFSSLDQDQLTSRHILLSQIVLNYNNGVLFH
jgi:hypothetical protein